MNTDSVASVATARVKDVVDDAKSTFSTHGLDHPANDAEWLMMSIIHCSRSDFFLHPDKLLSSEQHNKFQQAVNRRIKGEPPQYIIGEMEFYGRSFKVNPSVLIPRPETERLISETIPMTRLFNRPKIIDIGVGSGNIAITLAKELPESTIVGVEVSKEAVAVAEENKILHKSENFMCICLDVLTHHPDGIFDIMVSNPPYISVDEMSGIMSDVREFEPRSALTDGSDGLMFYKRYIQLAPLILVPGGWMIFEVGGGNHSEKVYNLFAHSAFQHCELIKDYNGDDRILKVQYCG